MDPVTYPTVTFRGQEYELKFRKSDIVRLQHENVDLFDINQYLDRNQYLWRASHMLAAGIAHVLPNVTWQDIADNMDWSDLLKYGPVLTGALGKVLAQAAGEVAAAKSPQIQ
jgi:hypothetical protein